MYILRKDAGTPGPCPPQARGLGAPRKFFACYGLFGRFSLRKHDLSVCFSVHIIKVKPAENTAFMVWTRTDARKHGQPWTHYYRCNRCYVCCVFHQHYQTKTYNLPSGRKQLRFSIFESKFLKGCSLKTPYMYASIYQTNREKWNIVWHLIVNPCTSYIIKPWSTFLSCLYITLNLLKFLLRQGRDKHMHNDVHMYASSYMNKMAPQAKFKWFEIFKCS